jgi:hypothetical protein
MKIDDDYFQADDAGKELLERARPFIGRNVRLVEAPRTSIGTIRDARLEYGHVEYLFHLDPRFRVQLPDFYVREGDFEFCEKPTDDYIKSVNFLSNYGS